MTVRGAAGSGKSFFIKALANTVREMFGDQNAVHISAPTGAAAHNVGGETIHRKFQVNPHRPENDIGKEAKARLKETKRRTVVEIIDERSMLTCKVVGAAERHTAEAAHGGSHANEDWGGIPVVVFVGDDYQLPPPTNVEKGAFDLMDSKTSFSQQKLGDASFGSQLLMNMSEKGVELRSVKRQNGTQSKFKEVLQNLRTGDPTHDDASFLMKLHLANLTQAETEEMEKDKVVMHMFATKAPRDEYNVRKLSENASDRNPAALVKASWKTSRRANLQSIAQHFDNPPDAATLMCRGSVVRIAGKIFEPDFGLFNNAIGTVEEIVFKPGKDPNNGDQPSYVAVRFEGYSGPAWDESEPKIVPIPMVTRRCNKGCCEVTYCPLSLSYGVTAHTFQGQSTGPVDEGQPKNAVDCVVFYPGNNKFEGNNPGLLYMGTSRATTSGTGRLDSALYFSGQDMNTYRVTQESATERQKWIERLDKNTIRPSWDNKEKEELITWAKTFRMSTNNLEDILSMKEWRACKA